MASCDIQGCDGDHLLRYSCNECNGTFCTEHRLPEDHNCADLRTDREGSDDQRFATGLQNKPGKKRGMTKREDTSSGSSPSPTSSSDSDSRVEDDKPYDTDRRWRSTADSDRTHESGASTAPESMDLGEGHTVGTARDPEKESSPDVAPDGSIKQSADSTTAPTTPHSETAGRLQTWVIGLLTTASRTVSDRLRRIAAWLWRVLTGFARLSGAALTLWGVGWMAASSLPSVYAGNAQQAIPGYRSVILLLVGILLVVTTKE